VDGCNRGIAIVLRLKSPEHSVLDRRCCLRCLLPLLVCTDGDALLLRDFFSKSVWLRHPAEAPLCASDGLKLQLGVDVEANI
jgi:hypothetical protein